MLLGFNPAFLKFIFDNGAPFFHITITDKNTLKDTLARKRVKLYHLHSFTYLPRFLLLLLFCLCFYLLYLFYFLEKFEFSSVLFKCSG